MTTQTKTFQLVKTPAVNHTEDGFTDVYSLLEINHSDDCAETNFFYDISRVHDRAMEILNAVKCSGLSAADALEEIL